MPGASADNLPSESESKSIQVQMRGIVKRFGENLALNEVNFTVRAGEIHALLGENGAGKSTLMHILSGLLTSDSGEITLRGETASLVSPAAARKAGVAMVHQHFTLVPAFTVAENLALDIPASRLGIYSSFRAARPSFDRAEKLGWHLPASTPVSELPVGVQQRIEIIKALSTDAKVLIFDEPTAVLSGEEIKELFSVFRQLREEGCAVILIAHKLSEILAVADTVTVLRRGQGVASAPVSDVTAQTLAQWMVGENTLTSLSEKRFPDTPSRESSSEKSPALSVENVSLSGDRGETVLKSLSFAVSSSEIYGIGGVDGNGQTELAELLVGLRKTTKGSLLWKNGTFTPGHSPKIGYIPQDRRRVGLATSMSIEDNLLFDAVDEPGFRWKGLLKRKSLRQLAQVLIKKFDIRVQSSRLTTASLSGGNQQKIVVARVFRTQPELIVAMNPTRGLDIGATRFVHEQLLEARLRGAAIVLISTDLDELSFLSDKTAILSGGALTSYRSEDTSSTDLGLLLGGSREKASLRP